MALFRTPVFIGRGIFLRFLVLLYSFPHFLAGAYYSHIPRYYCRAHFLACLRLFFPVWGYPLTFPRLPQIACNTFAAWVLHAITTWQAITLHAYHFSIFNQLFYLSILMQLM